MKVPFDLEMAKKITSGEMEGKIVTRKGYPSKILMFDMANIGVSPTFTTNVTLR